MQKNKTDFIDNWLVMYTKPNCEKKIANFLDSMAIEYYLPIKEMLSKWNDRYKLIKKPLFPSYIFVKVKSSQEYCLSLSSPYSQYYLKIGSNISVLSSHLVESIKIATERSKNYEIASTCKRGQKVLINGGVFMGLKGELVEFKGKNRVQVLIEMISSSILVTASPEFIYHLQ